MEKEIAIRNDSGGGRLDAVLNFARDHGYETVIERGEWKKATVYEMILSGVGEDAHIGIPQYIIDNGDDLRISDVDEAFDILDSLDTQEVEEE